MGVLLAIFYLIFTTLLVSSNAAVLLEGDSCTVRNKSGVCINQDQCPQLKQAYMRNEIGTDEITRCGDSLHKVLICCPIEFAPRSFIPTERAVGSASFEYASWEFTLDIRIIHGDQVSEQDDYGFMAAIGMKNVHAIGEPIAFDCGGALISDRFILTAAHCLTNPRVQPSVVMLGSLYLDNSDDEVRFGIQKIHTHPDFNRNSFYNDIGLIELKIHSHSSNVRPICLNTEVSLPSDESPLYVAGWGRSEWGSKSNELRKAKLSVVPLETCRNNIAPMLPNKYLGRGITDTLICAKGNGSDTCDGDSGGPLMYKAPDDVLYVAGITVGGFQCAGIYPAVYTRVVSYLKFIEDIVWPNQKSN